MTVSAFHMKDSIPAYANISSLYDWFMINSLSLK